MVSIYGIHLKYTDEPSGADWKLSSFNKDTMEVHSITHYTRPGFAFSVNSLASAVFFVSSWLPYERLILWSFITTVNV